MARVDHSSHLGRRDLLVVCWNYLPEFYGLLSPKAQWEVHRYYLPSKTLTDEEFRSHLKQLKLTHPSLSQRVGKHYGYIFTTFKSYADQVGKTN